MIVRKNSLIATVVAAVFIATGPSVAGQGRGSGGAKTHPPKPAGGTHTTVAKGPSAGTVQHGSPKGPKSTSTMAGGTAAKGPKTTSTSPKSGTASAKATGKSTTTAASAKATGSAKRTEPAKTTASAKKTEPAKTTTITSGTGITPTTTTLTPVQQKLQQNTNLASKLETRLPKGTDLMTASEGFRNLGQFVAAVNVSNNLGIDFVNLKTSMVDDGLSLGQAIQTWKPTANSTQEASRAESHATVLINSSSTTTTTTAKTRKPKSTSGGGLND